MDNNVPFPEIANLITANALQTLQTTVAHTVERNRAALLVRSTLEKCEKLVRDDPFVDNAYTNFDCYADTLNEATVKLVIDMFSSLGYNCKIATEGNHKYFCISW